MAAPRSESQRERDRLLISDLYVQGWTQQEIADKLGLNKNTVNSDIKFLLADWRKKRDGIAEEFESKYRYIHREAIAAWHKSKEPAETETTEMIDGGEPVKMDSQGKPIPTAQRLKASTRKEGQSGNPALLGQAQGALKAIREMYGVDAAGPTIPIDLPADSNFERALLKAYGKNDNSNDSNSDGESKPDS